MTCLLLVSICPRSCSACSSNQVIRIFPPKIVFQGQVLIIKSVVVFSFFICLFDFFIDIYFIFILLLFFWCMRACVRERVRACLCVCFLLSFFSSPLPPLPNTVGPHYHLISTHQMDSLLYPTVPAIQCEFGKEYQACGDPQQGTCEEPNPRPSDSSSSSGSGNSTACIEGCFCPEGYVMYGKQDVVIVVQGLIRSVSVTMN